MNKLFIFILTLLFASSASAGSIDTSDWFDDDNEASQTEVTHDDELWLAPGNTLGGYRFSSWLGLEGRFQLDGGFSNRLASAESAGYFAVSVLPKFIWQLSEKVVPFFQPGLAAIGYSAEFDNRSYVASREELDLLGVVPHLNLGAEFALYNKVDLKAGYQWQEGKRKASSGSRYGHLSEVGMNVSQFYVNLLYQF